MQRCLSFPLLPWRTPILVGEAATRSHTETAAGQWALGQTCLRDCVPWGLLSDSLLPCLASWDPPWGCPYPRMLLEAPGSSVVAGSQRRRPAGERTIPSRFCQDSFPTLIGFYINIFSKEERREMTQSELVGWVDMERENSQCCYLSSPYLCTEFVCIDFSGQSDTRAGPRSILSTVWANCLLKRGKHILKHQGTMEYIAQHFERIHFSSTLPSTNPIRKC